MTSLCSKLYQDWNDDGWNEYDLETLPASELRFLSRMAGISHSGSKEKLVVRLLSCRICRLELAKFGDDPFPLAAQYKRDRLRWMCIQANLWKSGSKVQLASVLLTWRNRCRMEGNKFFQDCRDYTKGVGFQQELAL